MTDNEITETGADGAKIVRFRPVPAHHTPEAMERLHTLFREEWDRGEIDPLLLIPTYVFDFLCIHPFTDGNGRMARLLTLLLLYQAGFEVGRYIRSKTSGKDTMTHSTNPLRAGMKAHMPCCHGGNTFWV